MDCLITMNLGLYGPIQVFCDWLQEINAPVKYQEVVYQTHKCPLFIGQHL